MHVSYGPDKEKWTHARTHAHTPNRHFDNYVFASASGLDKKSNSVVASSEATQKWTSSF